MRRWAVVAAISVMALTLATGASAAAPASVSPAASAVPIGAGTGAPHRVSAGSEWTIELTGGACETDSFAAHHIFTAVIGSDGAGGDRGTDRGTKTITMNWTAGTASGDVFKGSWRRSKGDYTGTDVQAGVSVGATLVPVAVRGCATMTTAPGSSSIALGSTDSDTATVTGEAGIPPTGDVHFYGCAGDAAPCTPNASGAVDLGPSALSGSGDTATTTSVDFSPPATGPYCFDAVYPGDGHYGSESDGSPADECFTVVPTSPAITTSPAQATIVLDSTDSDAATVTGVNGITPTGDVHFYVCAGDAAPCSTTTPGVTDLGTTAVAGSGATATADSAEYTPPATGAYCFLAVYAGDDNYTSATDGSTAGECFTVTSGGSGIAPIGVVALNKVGPHEVLGGGTGQFIVSGTIFLNTNVSAQPWSGSSASVTGTAALGTAASGIDITAGSNDTVDITVDGTARTFTIAAGSYSGTAFLTAVQSAVSGTGLTAAYNYSGQLVLSTRDGTYTASSLQVTGGDALGTLGLSVMAQAVAGNVFNDAIDAKANSNLYVYGTIDTNDGTVGSEKMWPLDTCFEPEGAIASGTAQTLGSGNPPGVQMSCTGDGNSSVTVDYNAVSNDFPQESDPLQGQGAPPNPFSAGAANNCPGMSTITNPTPSVSGTTTTMYPGVYTAPVDITSTTVFDDCAGYNDSSENNGQPEGAAPGIYLFTDGLQIDPASGDTVTGSDIVLATEAPDPIPGNVPGAVSGGTFTPSGPGNGAPCLPAGTLTDLQSGGGGAVAETDPTAPCGGTSDFGVVAFGDSSLSSTGIPPGTGTNFSALVGGQGTVTLTGPTTGAYGGDGADGIVLYQDPNTPANYGFDAEAGDSAKITINGVVYNASLADEGAGGTLDYWDGVGGGVVFYDGGTLQTGFGTDWSDGPTESSGSVTINGTAVVDDFNTDGTTDITIGNGTYSPSGEQSSTAHRTTRSHRHRHSDRRRHRRRKGS